MGWKKIKKNVSICCLCHSVVRACINILVLFSFSIIFPVLSWGEGHENVQEQCPTVWDCVFFDPQYFYYRLKIFSVIYLKKYFFYKFCTGPLSQVLSHGSFFFFFRCFARDKSSHETQITFAEQSRGWIAPTRHFHKKTQADFCEKEQQESTLF